MKLKFSDRCEQGTPNGVMLFRKDAEYTVTDNGKGSYTVAHEPRMEKRRVDGKRTEVPVATTIVDKALFDRLLKFAPVTLQE